MPRSWDARCSESYTAVGSRYVPTDTSEAIGPRYRATAQPSNHVGKLGDADRSGLTPLFTVNMRPYGEIQLNLDRRLSLATDGSPSA
jgi:hypothetical protein